MDWKKVGKFLASSAPHISTLLANPIGGAASLAIDLISGELGTDPTPDAVMAELQGNPDAIVRIKELEITHKTELERLRIKGEENVLVADTARMGTVNTTIQSELNAKYWWSSIWRPIWGVASAIAFVVLTIFICVLAYKAIVSGNPAAITMIPQLIISFSALFAIPGTILGVSAWHRGKEKRINAGEQKPGVGIVEAVAQRLLQK